MKFSLYQVDAFTTSLFKGNPAAICPLSNWLPDELMQKIAMENNLSETAFFVQEDDRYHIRWFTPVAEVALCGHATLAAAHILYGQLDYTGDSICFDSKSGLLTVEKRDELLWLNFPADKPTEGPVPNGLLESMNISVLEVHKGKTDYLLVLESQEDVEKVSPDFNAMAKIEARGVIVTAPGKEVDFVSRFFAPAVGVNEDPVTGSAHTLLVPFWANRLSNYAMTAQQLSQRGGELQCQLLDDRVEIGGQAITYLTGEITLPD